MIIKLENSEKEHKKKSYDIKSTRMHMKQQLAT